MPVVAGTYPIARSACSSACRSSGATSSFVNGRSLGIVPLFSCLWAYDAAAGDWREQAPPRSHQPHAAVRPHCVARSTGRATSNRSTTGLSVAPAPPARVTRPDTTDRRAG